MTYFDEVHEAKQKRDVVRDMLVKALKNILDLPCEVRELLAADEITTVEFHEKFLQYRLDKAVQEANPISVVRKAA